MLQGSDPGALGRHPFCLCYRPAPRKAPLPPNTWASLCFSKPFPGEEGRPGGSAMSSTAHQES